MSDQHYASRFRGMVRTLRANLADEKQCLYFMHTHVGTINVSTWNYVIPGFVAITGRDEHDQYRFLVFPDEQACSFPLEIKRRKEATPKEPLGFKPFLLLIHDGSEDEA